MSTKSIRVVATALASAFVLTTAGTAVAQNAAPDNANRYRRSGTTLYVFKLPG